MNDQTDRIDRITRPAVGDLATAQAEARQLNRIAESRGRQGLLAQLLQIDGQSPRDPCQVLILPPPQGAFLCPDVPEPRIVKTLLNQ